MTNLPPLPRAFPLLAALAAAVLCTAAACADAPPRLLDLRSLKEVTLAETLPRLAGAALVLVGESHGTAAHHGAQLAVIRALHESGDAVCVGLEMFQRREQSVLDRWVGGGMSEGEMEAAFLRNWGVEWPAYREVFLYCRDRGIPMAGLNVPREITRKVARQGFGALTPEEIGLLPPIACSVDPAYEAFLRGFTGSDGHQGAFERFCEAQLVWDAGMAAHALDFLRTRPQATMVVMTGSVHAWKPAMPDQIHRLAPQAVTISILPEIGAQGKRAEVTPEDADYLLPGM
jgi:uncharacterized iron-regulated protein